MEPGNYPELCLASRITSGTLLLVLFMFGILANLTICQRLHRPGVLFKRTTFILLNLAVTDLLGCIVLMPMEFVQLALNVLPADAQTYSSVFSSLQNFFLWLDCCSIILLSIDREELVRKPFEGRRKVNSTRGIVVALAGAWILAVGEAVLTYFTSSDRVPWKFQNGVSRLLEPGNFVANLLVVVAVVVVVVSSRKMQNLLGRTSESLITAGALSKTAINKRGQRVSRACVVTVGTLLISYMPTIIAILVWWASGLQSYEFNSLCAILSSVIHVLNPVICAGLCQKIRRGSADVTRGVTPDLSRQTTRQDQAILTRSDKVEVDAEVAQAGKESPAGDEHATKVLETLKSDHKEDAD